MEVTQDEYHNRTCVELDSGSWFSDYKNIESEPTEQTSDAAFKMEDIFYTRASYNVREGILNAFDHKDEMLA